MSAYICNPEHIGLLAALAVGFDRNNAVIYPWRIEEKTDLSDQAAHVATRLWQENVRSVQTRYPGDRQLPGPCLSLDDQQLAVQAYARHYATRDPWAKLRPADVISLVSGYEYQACEADDWRTTDAELQCDWLKHKAYRRLPGWDDAPWGWTEPESIPAVDALYENC